MKRFRPSVFFLGLAFGIIGCGGAWYPPPPEDFDLDVSALEGLTEFARNPVVFLWISKNQESTACSGSLVTRGYVLTSAHCVEGYEVGAVPHNAIFAFFKNVSDLEPTAFRVVRVLAKSFIQVPPNLPDSSYSLSEQEKKKGADPFFMDFIKRSQDWAILEIDDSFTAAQQFGARKLRLESTANLSWMTDGKPDLTYIAYDPPEYYRFTAELKVVQTDILPQFIKFWDEVLKEDGLSVRTAYEQGNTMVLADSHAVEGNSGGPVFYGDAVIGAIKGYLSADICIGERCYQKSTIQWLPAISSELSRFDW